MLKTFYRYLSTADFMKNTEVRAKIGRQLRNIFKIQLPVTPAIIIVNDDYKFLYSAVPKVASTSIKSALLSGDEFNCYVVRSWLQNLLEERIELEDYFKFSFVRNPWARTLSVYRDKISKNDPRFMLNSFNGLRRDMSFKEFAEWLALSPNGQDGKADRHWLSQNKFIACEGKTLVDYIGKQENFYDDIKEISKRLMLPDISIARLNTTGDSGDNRAYREYYDQYTKKLIEKRYQTDIDLFKYTF